MMIYFLVLAFLVLILLMLRFVRPELIYSFRYYLTRVQSTKTLLDSEASDEDRRADFVALMVNDHRYEVLGYDEEYIFERTTRLRRLYHVLDLRRGEVLGLPAQRQPQVCLIELANLLGKLAKDITPDKKYDYPPIDANEILTFIGNRIREAKGLRRPMVNEKQVADWFIQFPISIEQLIEILIAAVNSLAYRHKAQNNISLADTAPSMSELRGLIESTRVEIVQMAYTCFQKKYLTEDSVYQRMREILGEETYKRYAQSVDRNTSLFCGLSLQDLQKMIVGEKGILHKLFDKDDWLVKCIAELTPALNHSPEDTAIPTSDLLLMVRYCHDIKQRIVFFHRLQ